MYLFGLVGVVLFLVLFFLWLNHDEISPLCVSSLVILVQVEGMSLVPFTAWSDGMECNEPPLINLVVNGDGIGSGLTSS